MFTVSECAKRRIGEEKSEERFKQLIVERRKKVIKDVMEIYAVSYERRKGKGMRGGRKREGGGFSKMEKAGLFTCRDTFANDKQTK